VEIVPKEIRVARLRNRVNDTVVKPNVGARRISLPQHQNNAKDEGKNQDKRKQQVISRCFKH
jgi:hypothetical protein